MSERMPSFEPTPEPSPNELREKLRDLHFLPSHKDVEKASSVDPKTYYSKEWYHFCFDQENPVFELFNEEYINALSDYLIERVRSYQGSEDEAIVVLEVGAGNGRLTHFLQEKLNVRTHGEAKIRIVAIDSGDWDINPTFPVEQIDQREALEKYKPKVVISCWMPYEVDWTADFRAMPTVEEYILIGETDGGCVGDEWLTWGNTFSFEEEESEGEKTPPYIADGFERVDIDEVSQHQICRTDYPGEYWHSRTVSFRRKDT